VQRFWRLLSMAIAAEAAADIALAYNDVHYTQAPFPSVADAFFIAYFVLLFRALLRVPVAPASRARQVRMLLDAATLVVGGGALIWYFVLGPTAIASADHAFASAVSLAYPIGDLVVLAGLAAVLLRRTPTLLRAPLRLIAAAIVCSIVADVVYSYGVLHGTYTGGDPIDTLYVLQFALFALAAGMQRPSRSPASEPRAEDFAPPATSSAWLPYLGLAAGLGLVLGAQRHDPFFPDYSLLLIVVVLAALVGVRQWVVQRDLVRLQHALRENERRFRAIFDNAAVGITYTELQGPTIVDVNSTFAQMVGRTPEQLRGGDYTQIAHPAFHGADRALAEAVRSGAIDQHQQELSYITADGSIRWAMLSISTLRDEHGEPTHVVGIFEDITRRREAERVKDELVSIVGHELRTPLTSIRGSLGLLDAGVVGELPEEAHEMVSVAIANTDRLTRLVNDMLDSERIRAGRLELSLAAAPVAGLVAQSVQAVQAAADDAGVVLATQLEPLDVEADADRAVQTLVNLIGNAVKFSPRGGTVAIAVCRDGADAAFSVRDEGRGIPADQLGRIFERFNQVDTSDTRERGGTGLGLAIARSIVEQHGGCIWAESPPGAGATFHFTLPLAALPAAPASAPHLMETRS
jgi:PAS domain S-box-containing protein